jgi:hypothetical protein
MSEDVKVMVCPTGERIVTDEDDARVQAEALRLGVIEQIAGAVRNGAGQRGASVVTRDGNRMVAIIRWAGFEKASNNGWASMAISPANEKTAAWLVRAVNLLIGADAMALLPADTSCRN